MLISLRLPRTSIYASCAGALRRARVVRIGDVTTRVATPNIPHLVPSGYSSPFDVGAEASPPALNMLRWMAQKEALKQDVMLIGPPGGQLRRLALWWATTGQRERSSTSPFRATLPRPSSSSAARLSTGPCTTSTHHQSARPSQADCSFSMASNVQRETCFRCVPSAQHLPVAFSYDGLLLIPCLGYADPQ